MHTELYLSLAIALAPSINEIVKLSCLALSLCLLSRFSIIKPTRR